MQPINEERSGADGVQPTPLSLRSVLSYAASFVIGGSIQGRRGSNSTEGSIPSDISVLRNEPLKFPSTPARSVVVPLIAPIHGGIIQNGGKDCAFTGGCTPTLDFKGNVDEPRVHNLNQLRPPITRPIEALKSKAERLKLPFEDRYDGKKGSSYTLPFCFEDLLKAFIDVGIDYLLMAPAINHHGFEEMMNILTHPSLFVVSELIDFYEKTRSTWDTYDVENDKEAYIMLQKAVDSSLLLAMRPFQQPGEATGVIIARLWHSSQNTSVTRYSTYRNLIQRTSPTTFPGQDIEAYSAAISIAIRDLMNGNQFQAVDVLIILHHLTTVGCTPFSLAYESTTLANNKMIATASRLASNKIALQYLHRHQLDPISVLRLAVESYHDLRNSNRWTPSNAVKDPTAAPELNKLELVPGTEKRLCFNCGVAGHLAPDCPHPKKATAPAAPAAPSTHWRSQKPTGSVKTQVKNGKTYHFCEKCKKGEGFWTFHATSEHVPLPQHKANVAAAAATTATATAAATAAATATAALAAASAATAEVECLLSCDDDNFWGDSTPEILPFYMRE